MLSLGAGGRRVYLAVGATDLRKGFDGLYGLVRSRLEEDPMSGQLFVFCNAGRTRVKALYFDGSGLWLCAKRLEKGRFDWPQEIVGVAKVAVCPATVIFPNSATVIIPDNFSLWASDRSLFVVVAKRGEACS